MGGEHLADHVVPLEVVAIELDEPKLDGDRPVERLEY
eukprot:CAMPEP_0182805828 /NCGR_PEP_ID=MMETSP0006_2-20121128/5275_1 /TAXON_ID=97485 /ORGANISM="Prymnesium parvum, Strain Texoma1" /LENGTH=36 /DNA_ID= /DNA_START= /DNA_END= /DNA_ORIENTATION=